MIPSQRRAARMAIRIGIAAVLVAIAGAVSPFVAQAAVDLDARQAPWLSRALARATGSTLTDRIPLYPLIVPNPDARLPAPGQITLPGPTGSLLPGVVDSPHIADGLTSDGCAFCHRASSASEGKLTIAPYRDQSLKAAAEAYLGTEFGLCFRCHSEAPFIAPVGGTAFDLHALHLGGVNQPGTGGLDIRVPGDGQGNAICAECHFQLHLTAAQVDAQQVNFAPNVLPRGGVLTWTGPGSGTCTLTCHGVSHRAAGYEPAAVQNAALGVDARITIATSGTTLAGDAQTFTVTVERNDGTGTGWEPVDGIAVDPSPAGIGTITGGTCNDSAPDTNAAGQCTIIVNSTSAGTMTVNATAVVEVEGVVGPITVNVATDGHGAHDISNVATWVDARISIGTSGTNHVGDPQTFTVFVEKNGGSGWVGANAVTIDSTASGAGTITGGSCGSSGPTGGGGTCTIIVNSSGPGSSSVEASGTVYVGGVVIGVSTAAYGAHNISNLATWVDAQISIETSGTDVIGVPHTFTVTVTKNLGLGGGWVAAAGISVTGMETGVGSIDTAASTCDDTATDSSGQCLIVVTSDTIGQSTLDFSATVVLGGVSIPVSTTGYVTWEVAP